MKGLPHRTHLAVLLHWSKVMLRLHSLCHAWQCGEDEGMQQKDLIRQMAHTCMSDVTQVGFSCCSAMIEDVPR